MPLSVNLDPSPVRRSGGGLLILILLIALILTFSTWCLHTWSPGDGARQAGAFQEVQVAAGSGYASLNITVSGFRAGTTEDLSGFDIPSGERDKVPYYVWFTATSASGLYTVQDPLPIAADKWGAVSSDGKTLKGVLITGELQSCPQIDTGRLAAGEPTEGCFVVFNETGHLLTEASLNLSSGEIRAWRF